MKNKMIKRIFIMLMTAVIAFSGYSYLALAEYTGGISHQGGTRPAYGNNQKKEQLEAALEQLIDDGILTKSEAASLQSYLEKNRPEQGSAGQNNGTQDPISGAIEAGIITQSQAQKLGEILRPTGGNSRPMGGNSGQMGGRPGPMGGNSGQMGGNSRPMEGNSEQMGGNPGQMGGNSGQMGGNPGQMGGNPGQMGGNSGQMGANPGSGNAQGPREQLSSITFEEAQDIEAELLDEAGYSAKKGGYPIVDTGQEKFYSASGKISEPDKYDDFYGQDGNYEGNTPDYTDNGDGTITDNVTDLMWQQDPGEKMTWEEAVENLKDFELAGYDDWRLPTIKELYSLIKFDGVTAMSADESTPYIDTDYFEFNYGRCNWRTFY